MTSPYATYATLCDLVRCFPLESLNRIEREIDQQRGSNATKAQAESLQLCAFRKFRLVCQEVHAMIPPAPKIEIPDFEVED